MKNSVSLPATESIAEAQEFIAQGDIAALAETIQGFPKAVAQVAVFEGGYDDGPRAKLVFRCIDQSGHAVVRVSLVEFAYDNAQLPIMNDVNLEMRFEASALDQFCKELEAVGKRARKLAMLPANTFRTRKAAANARSALVRTAKRRKVAGNRASRG